MRLLIVLTTAACLSATVASGQRASTYVPLDHWTMPAVELLIRTGVLDDPSPLTRPLRESDLVAALSRVDTVAAGRTVARTVARLLEAFGAQAARPTYRAEVYAGGGAGTDARRSALRGQGNDFVDPFLGGRGRMVAGPMVLDFDVRGDGRYHEDPDYRGKPSTAPIRFPHAYISAQWKYAELTFGALSRNWGPTGQTGLVTSAEPYSYDHLYFRVGAGPIRGEVLWTELDSFEAEDGDPIRRHWTSSRLLVTPVSWLTLSVGHATLWAGEGRGWEPWWLNPLKWSTLTANDENDRGDVNSLYEGSARLVLPKGITLQGTFMLDDLQALWGTSPYQDRLGVTGVVDVPVTPAVSGRLSGALVSSIAYRPSEGPELTVMRRGVGLGDNFADYYRATLQFAWLPHWMIVVSPEVTLLRQGEGDFRQPTPPPNTDHPFLFEGTPETTWRIALGAAAEAIPGLALSGDAGVHYVRNAAHADGVSDTRFVGRIVVSYRLGFGGVLARD